MIRRDLSLKKMSKEVDLQYVRISRKNQTIESIEFSFQTAQIKLLEVIISLCLNKNSQIQSQLLKKLVKLPLKIFSLAYHCNQPTKIVKIWVEYDKKISET